jgi:hypothetical protein
MTKNAIFSPDPTGRRRDAASARIDRAATESGWSAAMA